MNFLFITPRTANDDFDNYLKTSLMNLKVKCAHIHDTDESKQINDISNKYNMSLSSVKKENIFKNTILVFCKPDIKILDEIIKEKLNYVFDCNPQVGLVGVLGIKEIHKNSRMYDVINNPKNGIIYDTENSNKGEHVQYTKNGFFDNIIGVDDSFFAIRGDILEGNDIKFMSNLESGFGIDIALKINMLGFDAVVADLLILSKSDTDVPFEIIETIVNENNITEYPISINSLNIPYRSEIVDVEI